MKNSFVTGMLLFALGGSLVQAQFSQTNSFTSLNKPVPDGNVSGLSDVHAISSSIAELSRVVVKLRIQGEFNGDLYGYLRHVTPAHTNFCILLNRPGKTASNPSGYADSGLDISFDDSAANGDIHTYQAVTVPPSGLPLTGAWQPDGRRVDPTGVLDTTPRTTTLGSFAGASASGEWTLFLADLESGGTNFLVSWDLELYGVAVPEITWAIPADITYGAALGASQLNASSSEPGTFTYNPPAGTVLNAGSGQILSVTFTPTDPTHETVSTNVTINVLKKSLTITANDKTKLYGASLPSLTAAYDGFVNGDTAASLDIPVSINTSATAASSVGSYPITVSGASDANYQISLVDGTLSITPAALTITAINQNKPYGAAVPGLPLGYNGFVNGDTPANLDTPPVVTTTATAASSVGSYPITVSGAADANYTITFVPGTFTVTPANLTIAANDQSKIYGASLPTLTVSYAGFANGDTASSLDTPPVVTTTATATSPVGTYPITVSGAADANYTISFVSGTLTVTPANLTITANDQSKVYGTSLPTLTVSYAGFANGDTASSLDTPPVVTTTATATSPVGTYPITVSGAADANYTISFVSGTFSVTPANLTITANDQSKVYGASLPALTLSYAGFANGDTSSSLDTPPVVTTTATATSPVGTYPITVSGAADVNYTISFAPGTLTITPATLTITAVDTNKVYGAPLPAFSAIYSGFVDGDTAAVLDTPVTFTTAATASSDVGTYAIQPGGATDANYTMAFVNGTLAITPASTFGSLTSSSNPALPGQLVTFTFTAGPVAPSTATPGGTVIFKVDGSPSPVDLVNGVAALSASTLPVGTHVIEAEYAGNANWIGTTNRLVPDQLINTLPVAAADQVPRYLPYGAKVKIATLLANDSDADSDAIAFVSASATSANGGTITRQGDWICYTAPEGFTDDDSFTYAITDGRGQQVIGTVNIQVQSDPMPSPNLTLTHLGDGVYRISFSGIPGIHYRIEYTDGLSPVAWQPLGSATADEVGMFELTDTLPNGAPQRFYRSAYP